MTDFRHAGNPHPFTEMIEARSEDAFTGRERREASQAMAVIARTASIAHACLEESRGYGPGSLAEDLDAINARITRLRRFLRTERAARGRS